MNLFPHVDWSRNASIYEVNVRQYTPEGTLTAMATHLPRLQKMGVSILWFMPIQPIGLLMRKGTLGSYYAIRDYTAVNPEFGTMADFCALVQQAHALGMKVILDWVANHTAWDHVWTQQHPEWYLKNAQGDIHSYLYDNGTEIEDWSDVCGLDYQQPALWPAMTEAMLYWLREADVDGFRCDVAGLLPTLFWEQARTQMEQIKPVFMLAEWADPGLHAKAFDMTYDWSLYEVLKKIARGEGDARDLHTYLEQPEKLYPADAYRMTFTANHDTNSWHGHDGAQYGSAFRAMAVLAATLPGMPLVYSGQESGLNKQLQFFEKDAIDWGTYEHADFYAGLLALKKTHPALQNGATGGPVDIMDTGHTGVFRFQRVRDGRRIQVTVNLTGQSQTLPEGTMLAGWAWEMVQGSL
ncbi:alpha-amylase family glycosyl hydrolase [Limnohabitans sp. WS1]|uniref:alpha-amylase family glycosyl hydrolase n=1 Tax=Limnohabitans sp. WS1 TaxID=1100726 RepID=UPI000D3D490C|nr:alpha-amylase family glycosyl hydrolase [Limnohabitans sp. WS1]PUE09677.1 alpha-amylase [Limnohabitans sp. WS1]